MQKNNPVTAVISLYNPNDDVVANCAALIAQVGHVVAVDDGSPLDTGSILGRLESLGATVVRLESNSGIASALNAGIRAALAQKDKPRFILTMDQDSRLEPGFMVKMLAAYDSASEKSIRVAMVAPGNISGIPTRRRGNIEGTILGGEPIQSGLLIPVTTLESLGLLMDELFIDGVDTEFYLRARKDGQESIVAPDARLDHALGSMVAASILGVKISINGRSLPVRTAASYRYYYIFRNRIVLVRRYWRSQFGWALKGLLADYRHLAIVTALAPGRLPRLGSAMAGVRDGLRGITGPRPTP